MRPGKPPAIAPSSVTTNLPAQDLAATRDFYLRDLGLTLAQEDSGRVVFAVGGATLAFIQHDGPKAVDDAPLLTFGCDDLDGVLKRLRALGVELDVPPSTPTAPRPSRFCARDPDGRQLMFVRRTP